MSLESRSLETRESRMPETDTRDGRREMGDGRWERGDVVWGKGATRGICNVRNVLSICVSRHPSTSHLNKMFPYITSCIAFLPSRHALTK